MSLRSMRTGTLNRSLVMPGLDGLTSVGEATASSSANRFVLDSSRGRFRLPSPAGSRLK